MSKAVSYLIRKNEAVEIPCDAYEILADHHFDSCWNFCLDGRDFYITRRGYGDRETQVSGPADIEAFIHKCLPGMRDDVVNKLTKLLSGGVGFIEAVYLTY